MKRNIDNRNTATGFDDASRQVAESGGRNSRNLATGSDDVSRQVAESGGRKTRDIAIRPYDASKQVAESGGRNSRNLATGSDDVSRQVAESGGRKTRDIAIRPYDVSRQVAESGGRKTRDIAIRPYDASKQVAESGGRNSRNLATGSDDVSRQVAESGGRKTRDIAIRPYDVSRQVAESGGRKTRDIAIRPYDVSRQVAESGGRNSRNTATGSDDASRQVAESGGRNSRNTRNTRNTNNRKREHNRKERENRKAVKRMKRKENSQSKKVELRKFASRSVDLDVTDTDLESTFVIICNRDETTATEMFGKEWEYKDPIWSDRNFKRVTGDRSKTVYIVDSETREVRIVYKITLFQDLATEVRSELEFNFEYVQRDQRFHSEIKCNHAQTGGIMKSIGYRAGTERGWDFGTYAMSKNVTPDVMSQHFSDAIRFHRNLGNSFLQMTPAFFRQRQLQVRNLGLPLLGIDYGNDTGVFMRNENLFTPQIAYTYGGFRNKSHRDNDISKYTSGIWAPVRTSDGAIVAKSEGFDSYGHFFYCSVYKTLIDFETIDGITEIVWCGPEDDHGTATGGFATGFTRYATTCQVNRQLNERVQNALKIGVANVKDNVVRLNEALERYTGSSERNSQRDENDDPDWNVNN